MTGVTTVSWTSRPQIAGLSGYDLYMGAIRGAGDLLAAMLASVECLAGDIPQPAGPTGEPLAVEDPGTLQGGEIVFYLAGHNPTAPGEVATLGLRSDGTPRPEPPIPCP